MKTFLYFATGVGELATAKLTAQRTSLKLHPCHLLNLPHVSTREHQHRPLKQLPGKRFKPDALELVGHLLRIFHVVCNTNVKRTPQLNHVSHPFHLSSMCYAIHLLVR